MVMWASALFLLPWTCQAVIPHAWELQQVSDSSCSQVPAASQGKFRSQREAEPNALSTTKYTGLKDNCSKSLCHYRFTFIGLMQPDLMREWTNNLHNLPAVELAVQTPDFDQSTSLYDWSVSKSFKMT